MEAFNNEVGQEKADAVKLGGMREIVLQRSAGGIANRGNAMLQRTENPLLIQTDRAVRLDALKSPTPIGGSCRRPSASCATCARGKPPRRRLPGWTRKPRFLVSPRANSRCST